MKIRFSHPSLIAPIAPIARLAPLIPISSVLAVLAACSSAPVQNLALEQARVRVTAAQSDAQIVRLAPQELGRATDSLRVAERAWSEGGASVTIDHLAYMSGQRAAIAQEVASSRASQAITAGASAERDQLRLAVRTNEANVANQQLALSQQSNAQKTAENELAQRQLAESQRANAQLDAQRIAEADAAKQQLAQSQLSNTQKSIDLAAANAATERGQASLDSKDAQLNDLELQLKDLNAKKTDRGMVVTVGDVLFDSGQARLLADGNRNMVKLADFFKRNPERTASIEGFTDSVGSAMANLDLSALRANAVMGALIELGVPASRMTAQAFGEEMPAASNGTPTGRQLNRRVEIVFATRAENVLVK